MLEKWRQSQTTATVVSASPTKQRLEVGPDSTVAAIVPSTALVIKGIDLSVDGEVMFCTIRYHCGDNQNILVLFQIKAAVELFLDRYMFLWITNCHVRTIRKFYYYNIH